MHNKSQDEWLSIQQSRIWDSLEAEKRIMLILKLSFDNLKLPSLKECFPYCSNFEKDFKLQKNDLIQLWMAQGWLHPSPNQSHLEMEDIGDQYFNILAENSLFQYITRAGEGNITCKMRDLVHDLAEIVSRSDSLAWNSNKNAETAEDVEDVPISIPPRIRSAFLNGWGNSLNSDIFARFRALRVLKLAGTLYGPISIAELPISIGEL